MTNSNVEKIKNKLIAEIHNDLLSGWMQGRALDIEREFIQAQQKLNLEKEAEIKELTKKYQLDKTKKFQQTETNLKLEIANLEIINSEEKQQQAGQTTTDEPRTSTWSYIFSPFSSSEPQKKLTLTQIKIQEKTKELEQLSVVLEAKCVEQIEKQKSVTQRDFDRKFSVEKERIGKEFEQQFQKKWNNQFKAVFDDQFERFLPQDIRTQLIKRHPWLKKEDQTRPDTLINLFLEKKLRDYFWSCLKDPVEGNWGDIDIDSIENFVWSEVDQDGLTKQIQGYLLSNASFYDGTHVFPTTNASIFSDSPLRYDIYGFIIKTNPAKFKPKKLSNDIYCTQMAPMHLNELYLLSTEEKAYLETIFVNIHTEESPSWVLLNKQNNQWVCYCPQEEQSKVSRVIAETGFDEQMTFCVVDSSYHRRLNDLPESNERWYPILFGRVLPWCQTQCENQYQVSLDSYRQTVPFPTLLQYFWQNTTNSKQVSRTFAYRFPFSPYSAIEAYRSKELHDDSWYTSFQHYVPIGSGNNKIPYLLNHGDLEAPEHIDRLLANFDKKIFDIVSSSSSPDTLTVSQVVPLKELIHGLKLTYHYPIHTLTLPQTSSREIENNLANGKSLLHKLVNYNLSVTTISPCSNQYHYFFYCAARNRFLASFKPNYLTDSRDNPKKLIELRHNAWFEVGKAIHELMQTTVFQGDEINQIIAFNQSWRKDGCKDDKSIEKKLWQLMQVVQMGKKGLDVLFEFLDATYIKTWCPPDRVSAPGLSSVFDLQGSLLDKPADYIKHLADKINKFGKGYLFNSTCAPLFKKLSFILPNELDNKVCDALYRLIEVLEERRKNFPEEACEVVFYNAPKLNNSNLNTKALDHFIDKLLQFATPPKRLQMMIQIPAWNKEAVQEQHVGILKAQYRKLQNKVKNNVRYARYPTLRNNTQLLQDCVNNKLKPQFQTLAIEAQHTQWRQSWEGENVKYPLTAGSPSIQKQATQQVAQQVAQQIQLHAEKQKEVHREHVKEIKPFRHPETDFITRENIDEKCTEYWSMIDARTKRHSGWKNGQSLRHLFNLFVGSDKSASFVIERIQPAAIREMMQFAPAFRSSIDWDHTPGFKVFRSPEDGALILIFSEEQKLADLLAHKMRDEKPDPYAPKLKKFNSAVRFSGDYRQFSTFSGQDKGKITDQHLQTFWQFLSLEDADPERIANHRHGCESLGLNDADLDSASVVMQHYNVSFGSVQPALDKEGQISLLKAWASKKYPNNADFIDTLFNQAWTLENFQSLGQLFNHYEIQEDLDDASEPVVNATTRWLEMAKLVFDKFPKHFKVWKERILDPIADWSDVLEKEEVDALVMSTLRLSERPELQAVLWGLVDAHGLAVGPMRFTEIWLAFYELVEKIQDRGLSINVEKFLDYFEATKKTDDFHATHFLRRLNFVLDNAEKMTNSHAIQQSILNQVDKIDWSHDGFDYYVRHERGCIWREHLKIENLESLIDSDEPKASYLAEWDNIDFSRIKDPLSYSLRYCDQRMHLNQRDFDAFQAVLTTHCAEKDFPIPILRLLIASKAIGVDSIEDLQAAKLSIGRLKNLDLRVINLINQQLLLDKAELNPYSYRLRIVDVSLLVEVLSDQSDLDLKLDLELINTLGKALHCYAKMYPNEPKKRIESLRKLIDYGRKKGFDAALLTTYPWLIERAQKNTKKGWLWNEESYDFSDPIHQNPGVKSLFSWKSDLDRLGEQLRSIDWKLTSWFPSYDEIKEKAKDINDQKIKKSEVIADWIARGCEITDQDAPYRRLAVTEIEALKNSQYLNLSLPFKEQNKILYEKLLSSLVLPIGWQGDIEEHFKALFDFFAKIDCKTHYNELGMLLGLLLTQSQSSQPSPSYYALDQLMVWLESLYEPSQFESGHYPVSLIKEILQDALATPNSSLLNQNLLFLKAVDPVAKKLRDIFISINAQTLSYRAKKTLVQLAIQLKNDRDLGSIIHQVKDTLIRLKENASSPNWEDRFCHLLIQFVENPQKDISFSARLKSIMPLMANTTISSSSLKTLWESNQAKLLDEVVRENISVDDINRLFSVSDNVKEQYIRMILVEALSGDGIQDSIVSILEQLRALPSTELKQLAEYYSSKPTPTLANLCQLFQSVKTSRAADLIHPFESVIQATDKVGKSKRIYSLESTDIKNISDVLEEFKLKGKGFVLDDRQKKLVNFLYYTNTYSQFKQLHQITTDEVVNLLHERVVALKKLREPKSEQADMCRAQILACMREVLMRKTGKWLNHTQMFALLYAASHNDESLLHQICTGEGKSLIAFIRVSFRACMGELIDGFSQKECLSLRDYEEFGPVFDAFRIRHSHIHAGSKAHEYHSKTENGIGAVNYTTAGNLGIFFSSLIWAGEIDQINLRASNRVAFVDEGDYVMLEENTLFNSSDKVSGDSAYNLDEWVYREAYQFYLNYRDLFEDYISNCPSVYRNNELKALCEHLQSCEAHMSPKQSQFFREYIIPAAINPSADNLEARDQQLRQLLVAAHIASGLVEDKHFCVMTEQRKISDSTTLETNFAKIMIKNQVYHGSIYSDGVHDLLHARLNWEAVQKGKAPNFFVEPNREITLSLNARYMLKNYYARVEACTGTAGDEDDLKFYEEEFGIRHVIKLPRHLASKTEFMKPIYCVGDARQVAMAAAAWLNEPDSASFDIPYGRHEVEKMRENLGNLSIQYTEDEIFNWLKNPSGSFIDMVDPQVLSFVRKINVLFAKDKQIQCIVDEIIKNKADKPILAICADDNAVVELGEEIQARLAKHKDYRLDVDLQDTHGQKHPKFILNINKNGRTEAEVLPFVGRVGSSTIDSSMKRGTHIPLEDENHGLYVIRTYAAMPSTVKQEYGRQGRNGLAGFCQDVLNFAEIEDECLFYNKHRDYKEQFEHLYKKEKAHLQKKLDKHERNQSTKAIWMHIRNHEQDREKYLQTRTLQRLKHNIQKANNQFIQRKDYLISSFTSQILEKTLEIADRKERQALKKAWKSTRKKIDSVWNKRLVGDIKNDSEQVYEQFLQKAYALWNSLYSQVPQTASLKQALQENLASTPYSATKAQASDMSNVIDFYQMWVKQFNAHCLSENHLSPEITKVLCGEQGADLDRLYLSLNQASCYYDRVPSPVSVTMIQDEIADAALSFMDPDAHTQHRTLLFSQLKTLFETYPACFSLSSKTWSVWLEKMAHPKETDTTSLDDRLLWVKTFFQAIQKKTPNTLKSPHEARVINVLFDKTMRILETKYMSEDNASLRFVINLTELILMRYIDKVELLDPLEQLLATNPRVNALIIKHVNKADLKHILDLFTKNNQATLSALIAYLDENSLFLEQHPGCIRVLFDWFYLSEQRGFIPTPAMLPDAVKLKESSYSFGEDVDKEVSSLTAVKEAVTKKGVVDSDLCEKSDVITAFFAFLGQRPGFDATEYHHFVDTLSADQKYLSELLTLPPYVRLAYLTTHLAADPGQYDVGAFNQQVAAIKQASTAFNYFLKQRNIINTTDVFGVPNDLSAYQKWTDYFVQMRSLENQFFFTMVNENGILIHEDILSLIAQHYRFQVENKKPPSGPVLLKTIHLGKAVSNLGKKHEVLAFNMLYEAWKNSNFDTDFYENILSYLQSVHTMASSLEETELKKLNQSVIKRYDKQFIDTSLAVYSQLIAVYPRKIASKIRRTYSDLEVNHDKNQRYFDFCQVVKEEGDVFTGVSQVDVFLNAFVNTQTISTTANLQQAFSVYKAIRTNNRLLGYFLSSLDDVNIKKQARFTRIIQRFDRLSDDIIELLHYAYIQKGTMSSESLAKSIEVIQKLGANQFEKTGLLSTFLASTPSVIDNERVEKYHRFVNKLEPIKALQSDHIMSLHRAYIQEDTMSAAGLAKAIKVIQKLGGPQFNTTGLLGNFLANDSGVMDDAYVEKYDHFVNLLLSAGLQNDHMMSLHRAYIQDETINAASLAKAIKVIQKLGGPQFNTTGLLGTFLANDSGVMDDAYVEKYDHFVNLLLPADLQNDHMMSLHHAYIQDEKINAAGLAKAIKVIQQLAGPRFHATGLLGTFLANAPGVIDDRRVEKYQNFINLIHAHPDLPVDAINQLVRSNYLSKTNLELEKAIAVMRVAIDLKQTTNRYENYFGMLKHNQSDRVNLICFLKLGLLDFLGEDFKTKCYSAYENLCRSACEPPRSGPMLTWYQTVNQVMQEFLRVLSPTKITRNCQPIDFSQHIKQYQSSWFVSSSRKKQFQTLQNTLKTVSQSPSGYYKAVFKAITDTQCQIINDDRENNSKRFFSHTNAKGHSRLYDITTKILNDTLHHYHALVANGGETLEDYRACQAQLEQQISIHCGCLKDGLPNGHPIRTKLESISMHKSDTEQCKKNKLARLMLDTKDEDIPKHLRHILKSIQCYITLTKKDVVEFAEGNELSCQN